MCRSRAGVGVGHGVYVGVGRGVYVGVGRGVLASVGRGVGVGLKVDTSVSVGRTLVLLGLGNSVGFTIGLVVEVG